MLRVLVFVVFLLLITGFNTALIYGFDVRSLKLDAPTSAGLIFWVGANILLIVIAWEVSGSVLHWWEK
jgi:hypothetical protein